MGDLARSLYLCYLRNNRGKKSLHEFKGGVHGKILLDRYIAEITSDYLNKFVFMLLRIQLCVHCDKIFRPTESHLKFSNFI
jgi:hypothetical protein